MDGNSKKFKVGDLVKVLYASNNESYLRAGNVHKVLEVNPDNSLEFCHDGYYWSSDQFQLVEDVCPTNPPHNHAELIKAWADGAEIQVYSTGLLDWHELEKPSWVVGLKYRIKPAKSAKDTKLEELEANMRKLADEIKELQDD